MNLFEEIEPTTAPVEKPAGPGPNPHPEDPFTYLYDGKWWVRACVVPDQKARAERFNAGQLRQALALPQLSKAVRQFCERRLRDLEKRGLA